MNTDNKEQKRAKTWAEAMKAVPSFADMLKGNATQNPKATGKDKITWIHIGEKGKETRII